MSETTFPPGTVLTVSPSLGERSVVKSAPRILQLLCRSHCLRPGVLC